MPTPTPWPNSRIDPDGDRALAEPAVTKREEGGKRLASSAAEAQGPRMVIVRFEDAEAEKQALGWLAGRFSFKTWSNGDLMLHERVLPYLARQGIPFKVQGPATYERFAPAIRNPDPAVV
jgi:hypothetical protein